MEASATRMRRSASRSIVPSMLRSHHMAGSMGEARATGINGREKTMAGGRERRICGGLAEAGLKILSTADGASLAVAMSATRILSTARFLPIADARSKPPSEPSRHCLGSWEWWMELREILEGEQVSNRRVCNAAMIRTYSEQYVASGTDHAIMSKSVPVS